MASTKIGKAPIWDVFARKARNTRTDLKQAWQYLTLKPFDTSTEAGRASERYRRAGLTAATNLVARVLTALVSLLSIPLTIGYLGKERYGIWMAINALLAWGNLADFGLKGGLLNQLSEAYGKDDNRHATKLVSTAFLSMAGVAAGLGLFLAPCVFFVPWDAVLNLTNRELIDEARWAVLSVLAVFLMKFPLGIVSQIYAAYQRAYISHVFSIASGISSLGVLLIVIELEGSLPWLIFATGGVRTLFGLLNFGYLGFRMPWIRPRVDRFSSLAFRGLAGLSAAIFAFQVGSLLINELQLIVISHARSIESVAEYSIFLKVFSAPVAVIAMIDGPLLPAFREAYARRDHAWLRSAFLKSQMLKIYVSLGASVLMLVAGNVLSSVLSRGTVQFETSAWLCASLLLLVASWNGGYNSLLMALDRVWLLVGLVLLNGVVTAPLTYYLGKLYGISGIICATGFFSLAVHAWLCPVLTRDYLSGRSDVLTLRQT